jgi:hypothetical protein
MNVRHVSLLFLLFIGLIGQGQNTTHQVSRDYPLKKIKRVVLKDLPKVEVSVEPTHTEIPEPHGNYHEAKAIRNQSRKRPKSNLAKYNQTPDDIKPTVIPGFDGIPIGAPGVPNDNNMAVSNGGIIVSAVNSSVTIFDENGDFLLYRPLGGLVRGQLTGLDRTYDPKLVYDPDADRFILVFLQGSTSEDTRIVVGFTETNDPTEAWNFYAVEGNPFTGQTWSDYPIIAISKDDLFITVNILRDGESWQEGFTQSVIWQIDKQSGYDGSQEIEQTLFSDLFYENQPIWSICAIPGGMTNTDDFMYFLSVRPGDLANDTVFIHKIDGSQASGNSQYSLELAYSDSLYGVPPSAFQPGPDKLQTNDCRVLSGFVEGNYLQYVQTTYVEQNQGSGVFHAIIDLETKKIKSNYIFSDSLDYGYPSISCTGDANSPQSSVITFSHSGVNSFPGTSAIFHNRIGNAPSIYSEVVRIKSGLSDIDRLASDTIEERWGDYTGIQRKYDEGNVVWLTGSYGDEDRRNGVWVSKLEVDNTLSLQANEVSITAFPNPVAHISTIQVTNPKEQKLQLSLVSKEGKVIRVLDERILKEGVFDYSFNSSGLRPGVYLLVLRDAENKPLVVTRILTQ